MFKKVVSLVFCASLMLIGFSARAVTPPSISVYRAEITSPGQAFISLSTNIEPKSCGVDYSLNYDLSNSTPVNGGLVQVGTSTNDGQFYYAVSLTGLQSGRDYYYKASCTYNGDIWRADTEIKKLVNSETPQVVPSYSLTTSKIGTGSGTVFEGTVLEPGSVINCGSNCSASFLPGASVTLSASPSAGSVFTSWQGCGSNTTNPTCIVQMNEVKNIVARFTAQVALPDLKILSVSPQPAMEANRFDLAVYFQGQPGSALLYKFKLTNKIDGKVYYTAPISNTQTNVDFILPFGTYETEIKIDSENTVLESDETNNVVIKNFSYCGANQTAVCGVSNNASLKIFSNEDFYSGKTKTYYSDAKSINLMNFQMIASGGDITLNSLSFAPGDQDNYLANLVNIKLMKDGQEIARVAKTFASQYWSDSRIPKVPGYFNFENINLLIPTSQNTNLSVTAELGAPVTGNSVGFSYNLNAVQAIKSDGTKIYYDNGALEDAGRGNLPIKSSKIVIRPNVAPISSLANETTTPIKTNENSNLPPRTDYNATSTTTAAKLDSNLANRLKGQIVLQVESKGEAYYVNPKDSKGYYMTDGSAAYSIMRNFGTGISNKDLDKIKSDVNYRKKYIGKIFLQVESRGEAYYISSNGRYNYLKDGAAAYTIMRSLGLGITNNDLKKIDTVNK